MNRRPLRAELHRLSVLCCLVITGGVVLSLAPAFEAAGQSTAGPARHRMTRITDTIYRADAPGTPGINSTSWVFINDTDVLVTDSEGSPASARALLAGVKSITSKPVRYLVDTHFHLDHAYGNAGLPPDVQIIGHDYTRKALLGPEARTGTTITFFTTPMPGRIAGMKAQASAETDPATQARLHAQIASAEATLAAYSGDFPLKPPDVTISQSMSLWAGAKEFRIQYLGRAHTAGDLIVYVPSERVAATGDILFKGMVGWQGDAYPTEHPATLDGLKPLDLELLLPAHGDHIEGRAAIGQAIASMQAYLRDEVDQVVAAKKAGLTPEQALTQVNLASHQTAYGQGTVPSLPAVRRIYDIIDGKVAVN